MSGCHASCDTDSNNSFFDGNEEMRVRFPPTQLIRCLKAKATRDLMIRG